MPLELGDQSLVLGGIRNDTAGHRPPRRSTRVPEIGSLASISRNTFSHGDTGQIYAGHLTSRREVGHMITRKSKTHARIVVQAAWNHALE
jgi:hypothetical protein